MQRKPHDKMLRPDDGGDTRQRVLLHRAWHGHVNGTIVTVDSATAKSLIADGIGHAVGPASTGYTTKAAADDQIVYKAFAGATAGGAVVAKGVKGDPRTFRVIASTGDVDRDGDVIEPSGWQIDAAPTCFLYSHDRKLIVGAAENVRVVNGRLEATCRFAPAGVSQLADEICGLVAADIIRSVSVGFLPLTAEPRQGGGYRITSAELVEISWVAAPSNRGAGIVRSSGDKSVTGFDDRRRAALTRASAAQALAKATLAQADAKSTLSRSTPPRRYGSKAELLAAARDAEAAAQKTLHGTAHALPMPAQSRGVRAVRLPDGTTILR